MDIRIIHFYPDLMSLYGSYANVSVLRRLLERAGNTVTVETVVPGQDCDLADADFLFMGAGTERAQKAALADFTRFGEAVKAAAQSGTAMLFCGTAMELLGKTITDCDGKVYEGMFHNKMLFGGFDRIFDCVGTPWAMRVTLMSSKGLSRRAM